MLVKHNAALTPQQLKLSFVLETEHPRYKMHMEAVEDIDTSKTKAYLLPYYALGQFAPRIPYPFLHMRSSLVQKGLFKVNIDN